MGIYMSVHLPMLRQPRWEMLGSVGSWETGKQHVAVGPQELGTGRSPFTRSWECCTTAEQEGLQWGLWSFDLAEAEGSRWPGDPGPERGHMPEQGTVGEYSRTQGCQLQTNVREGLLTPGSYLAFCGNILLSNGKMRILHSMHVYTCTRMYVFSLMKW
jgi:hypothetical protein